MKRTKISTLLSPNSPTERQTVRKTIGMIALMFVTMSNVGCWRPYEPVQLETIGSNEEGFLIPLQGDGTKQVSSASEEFLAKNLVHTKQVRIPQQWVQLGYQWFGMPNGEWRDAAVLIKVDRSPVTREWTADPNSGTSNSNQAVWVMTADQVEFSTGWTCTARIATREDAVKFLSNYPNGSLETVMDREIRAKLQAIWGMEVTDVPMDTLRKAATPHIQKTIQEVETFFSERGIQITNLGITGGFVYKDKTIEAKIVEVFNAEQEKNVAAAATLAQEEKNKKIKLEAEAKAQALLTERKAEAEGILAVAEARRKETEVVSGNPEVYMTLRRVELEKAKMERWNGAFPTFFMGASGTGAGGGTPDFLLNVPAFAPAATQNK